MGNLTFKQGAFDSGIKYRLEARWQETIAVYLFFCRMLLLVDIRRDYRAKAAISEFQTLRLKPLAC
jgi:hypothetical protein